MKHCIPTHPSYPSHVFVVLICTDSTKTHPMSSLWITHSAIWRWTCMNMSLQTWWNIWGWCTHYCHGHVTCEACDIAFSKSFLFCWFYDWMTFWPLIDLRESHCMEVFLILHTPAPMTSLLQGHSPLQSLLDRCDVGKQFCILSISKLRIQSWSESFLQFISELPTFLVRTSLWGTPLKGPTLASGTAIAIFGGRLLSSQCGGCLCRGGARTLEGLEILRPWRWWPGSKEMPCWSSPTLPSKGGKASTSLIAVHLLIARTYVKLWEAMTPLQCKGFWPQSYKRLASHPATSQWLVSWLQGCSALAVDVW